MPAFNLKGCGNLRRDANRPTPDAEPRNNRILFFKAAFNQLCNLTPLVPQVRTRLIARPDQFRGVVDCFYQVITKEGPGSLYRGLLPGIVSMAPAGAVFYGVYDLLKAQHLR